MSDLEQQIKEIHHISPESIPKGPLPVNFGVVVFPGFQALDAFGPLDVLNTLSFMFPINLSIIAATLDPVPTKPQTSISPIRSDFSQSISPTHTFATAPSLDVLLVPGGIGVFDPSLQDAIEFVARVYPSLKYLVTVCNGAAIAAQAGVLDGKKATTAKRLFKSIVAQRPQVKWVAHARWVVDGNVWTSSGASAGLDIIFAFITTVYGVEAAEKISTILEYERHTDPSWDPYAKLYELPEP